MYDMSRRLKKVEKALNVDGDTLLAPGQYRKGSTINSIMPDDYSEETETQSYNPMMKSYVPPR